MYAQGCGCLSGHLSYRTPLTGEEDFALLADSGVTAQNTELVERRVLEEVRGNAAACW